MDLGLWTWSFGFSRLNNFEQRKKRRLCSLPGGLCATFRLSIIFAAYGDTELHYLERKP
jgi:hypothetical protein